MKFEFRLRKLSLTSRPTGTIISSLFSLYALSYSFYCFRWSEFRHTPLFVWLPLYYWDRSSPRMKTHSGTWSPTRQSISWQETFFRFWMYLCFACHRFSPRMRRCLSSKRRSAISSLRLPRWSLRLAMYAFMFFFILLVAGVDAFPAFPLSVSRALQPYLRSSHLQEPFSLYRRIQKRRVTTFEGMSQFLFKFIL